MITRCLYLLGVGGGLGFVWLMSHFLGQVAAQIAVGLP